MAFIYVNAAMFESGFQSVFILPHLWVGVYGAWWSSTCSSVLNGQYQW